MLQEALANLKSRKGVSLYAIKKYMTTTHDFDTEKMGYLLKRQIKAGIEDGSIVQVKGNGVSGSFKLVSNKKNPENKENKVKKPRKMKIVHGKTSKSVEDGTKAKPKSLKSKQTTKKAMDTEMSKEEVDKATKKIAQPKKTASKSEKATSSKDEVKKSSKSINKDKNQLSDGKKLKTKMAPVLKTPAKKKAAMMKRKSIGSIIKTPRMKPRAK